MSQTRFLISAGALFACLAVILGAFGAHALKGMLSPERLLSYETAVKYQFYHSFALIICGILIHVFPGNMISLAGKFFFAGIIIFSGSIYLLSLREQMPFSVSFLGPVTPLGGLCFVAGWIMLFIHFLRTSI